MMPDRCQPEWGVGPDSRPGETRPYFAGPRYGHSCLGCVLKIGLVGLSPT